MKTTCALVLLALAGCSKPDAIALNSFQAIVKKWEAAHGTDIVSASYNVEKTTSLVSPYLATCEIEIFHHLDGAFKASARHKLKVMYARQDDAWVAKSQTGTVTSLALSGTYPVEVTKLMRNLEGMEYDLGSAEDPVASAMAKLTLRWSGLQGSFTSTRNTVLAKRKADDLAAERQRTLTLRVKQVKVGVTTEADLLKLMGPPAKSFPSADKKQTRYLFDGGKLVFDVRVVDGVVDAVASFNGPIS